MPNNFFPRTHINTENGAKTNRLEKIRDGSKKTKGKYWKPQIGRSKECASPPTLG